tara:strand:- start:26902 stop:27120 length:219 start_codon:yes stop_codon:yes gene_type:complete
MKRTNKKGTLKESFEILENELPLFFKNPKTKEHSVKGSSNFTGLDEFPVYNSKSSSCQQSYKPISKIHFINE